MEKFYRYLLSKITEVVYNVNADKVDNNALACKKQYIQVHNCDDQYRQIGFFQKCT